MKAIEAINQKMLKSVPDLKPGDTVRVHTKIIEGTKERIQVFEGVVLRVKGGGIDQTFTVRKISYGVGVERTFLIQSPKLAKIEIKKRAKVRRAYLTYLRGLRGKAAKLKDVKFDSLVANNVEPELKPEDLAPSEIVSDADITEIIVEETEDAAKSDEVSIEDIAKSESKETLNNIEEAEGQVASEMETEEGLEKSEEDLEKGKSSEGSVAEKNTEDIV